MRWYRQRFPLYPIAKDIPVGALQQAADRGAQFQKPWRDFGVQPLLLIHRGEQTDRNHHEGLILRRP